VGATYDLTNLKNETTMEGKAELIQKAKDLLNFPFEVTHQDWGIRPSTIDRRPLIGEHPKSKNILIFNGLGTKGVSLAPYFSDQLASYLMGEGNLDKEANINRVKSLYSRFQ
ncbi:MAG: FAD-dependent oxidoreductase, partial [Cyclobacteriaceae bacterium]